MTLSELLIESSLGRVFQHVHRHENDPSFSWSVISSWRSNLSNEENNRRFRQFKRDVRAHGFGYFELEGHGQEEDGGVSIEPSLFILNIRLKAALKLAKKYDQYAVIYSGPETEPADDDGGARRVMLVQTDGKEYDQGEFHPNRMGKYYSKLLGRSGRVFTFEGIRVRPQNNMERLIVHHRQLEEAANMRREGGWISPQGDILISTQTHSHDITAHPEKFGFTREYVQGLYDRHGERFGQEGEARETLIVDAVKRGWIRFRRYDRADYWSITANRLDRRTRNNITDFFRQITGPGVNNQTETNLYMDVRITELATGNVNKSNTVEDVVKFALMENKEDFESVLVLKEWKDYHPR